MSVIHMDTKHTRSVAQQMVRTAGVIYDQAQSLASAIHNLDWQGPSRDALVDQADDIMRSLGSLSETGSLLGMRVQREVEEWLEIDNKGAAAFRSIGAALAGIVAGGGITTGTAESGGAVSAATPELVAAILADEANRRDFVDDLADTEAWFIIRYEGKLEEIERYLLEHTTGQSIEEISLGKPQMNPEVVMDMVDQGYLPKPEGWEADKLDKALEMLLDDDTAPELVEARINQIVEHWAEEGVDISNRPDVIGTLYSQGLEGASGVHPDPKPNDRGLDIANMAKEYEKSM